MTGAHLRLLSGNGCWWAVEGDNVARLPMEAVVDDCNGRRLVPDARVALEGQGFFDRRPRTAYAVTVLTATACNLGCAYCFQNTALPEPGSQAPPRIRAATLTPDRVKRTAEFIRRQLEITGLDKATLLLFGGEPLLNPSGTLHLLRAVQEIGLAHAEIVTNGVLLKPDLATELVDAGLRRAQITFDGARETHDRIRVTRNGRGTYDTILRNVRAAAKHTDLSWHFRVNISHRNLEGIDRLIDDLGSLVEGRRASLHLALIDDVGFGYDNDIGYDDEYAQRFIELNDRAIRYGMSVPLSKPLSVCPYCSVTGGGSGAVINADGILYSCWETAGRDEWAVGDIDTGYITGDDLNNRWVACDYDIKAHGTSDQARRFFDQIDAAALDAMRARRLSQHS